MSAANDWSTRFGVDSAAGGDEAVARGVSGAAAGPGRVSNVLVSRSRNFRQVGASSPLGSSLRGSLLAPFFGASARAASLLDRGSAPGGAVRGPGAGAAFGSTADTRGPAGAAGVAGLAVSPELAGCCSADVCSADGRRTSGTSRDRRRGGTSAGGRSPVIRTGGRSDREVESPLAAPFVAAGS